MIANATSYILNHTLHSDFKIQTVLETPKTSYILYRERLANHSNLLISALNFNSIPDNPPGG